jgi:hypothetical protein
MTNEPPRYPWEEDVEEVDEYLWKHGYKRIRGFEGTWRRRADAEPVTRAEALQEIAERYS